MKKLIHFNGILLRAFMVTILANICNVSGQSVKQQIPIPENINRIFETSCMQCHGNKGGRFPKSRLNFSRWTSYGTAKEIEKASSICSSVRKRTMPPKSVRESKPGLIPTREQVDLICEWAESIKSQKVKK